ncbi:MAG: RsbRD N-terminal domain-containing protein [Deltaproteobacteria bacterium]|nr:RsbRD N-terminal domain-containing protein [Deltaproteobacteria bacterium]
MVNILVSKRLVELIERNADELTHQWLDRVRKHPGTPTYHTYDKTELYNRAYSVYSQLGKWLSTDTTKEEIARIYTAMGRQRHAEGFKLSEVIEALVITRRVLWFKIQSEGLLNTALELNLALDLSNHIILFFDRATIYTAIGFES